MPPVKKKNRLVPAPAQDFPVVGIGASAGGLDAFRLFLSALPKKSGMAFILVQHLSPSHESILPEILAKSSKIPVIEITDDTPILADHVYVLPANKVVTVADRKLQLTRRQEQQPNYPIDTFFISLSSMYHGLAIGVVLSGTGIDGSLGLEAIKENGGITIAQNLRSAAFQGMPQHAINTGMVDFVLPPDQIPTQLLKIRDSYKETFSETETFANETEEMNFRNILLLLRESSGIDFNYYKPQTIRRRIARRMMLRKTESLGAYLKCLRGSKEEQASLFQDVLIPVTSFFRDAKFYKALTDSVLPALLKSKPPAEPIRIWVAGCSTGEEAYSLAICLHELLGDKFASRKIRIFATDVSEKAVERARTGHYSRGIATVVSAKRLKNYFTPTDSGYQVSKMIRNLCVFAPQNFLNDPPFSNMDLVSCRNVLIYMNNYLQNKAFSIFHYALREKGVLLLGKSETPGTNSIYFSPLLRGEKIFTRKTVSRRFTPVLGIGSPAGSSKRIGKLPAPPPTGNEMGKRAERILLADYTPAAVIINEEMDVVHVHGSLSPFLAPSPGKPNFNLFKMVREVLAFELRSAVQIARETREKALKENLPLSENEKSFLVSIEVLPLDDNPEPHYLVVFHRTAVVTELPLARGKAAAPKQTKLSDALRKNLLIEKELAQTRENMRAISDEQEAANEELQSANEELLSSSEELQSLNEELETSKEELQSSNEELTVVNQELGEKHEQLNESLHYTESIIATIREPLIILDKYLRIKSANSSFYKMFQLKEEETTGKLFYELQNHQWDDAKLRNQLEKVLPTKSEMSNFEITLRFAHLGERTMLMNARQVISDNTVKLILLAIEDITEMRLKEHQILESEAKFRQLAESIPMIIWTTDEVGKRNYSNEYLLNFTGLPFDEMLDEGWQRCISPVDQEKVMREWRYAITGKEEFTMEFRIRRRDGECRWHRSRVAPQKDKEGNVKGWVGISIDFEDEVTASQRKDDFIHIASHELKTPITTLKGYVQLLRDQFESVNDQPNLVLANRVHQQVEKMIRMINVLFNVARVNEGHLHLDMTRFDLDELIRENSEALQLNFGSSPKIELELKAGKSIMADRDKIEQVLTNLITNARKFSPSKGKILVTSSASNGQVSFCVRDFGIGLSKDVQADIFKRYFRVEQDGPQHKTGLGLGLYIISEIVKLHEGSISVDSEINEGAAFCVTLPA